MWSEALVKRLEGREEKEEKGEAHVDTGGLTDTLGLQKGTVIIKANEG